MVELHDHERTQCEVWSRVMGYHRPITNFNPGKQQEHKDRVYFKESKKDGMCGLSHQCKRSTCTCKKVKGYGDEL